MEPVVATILDGYRAIHQQLRAELEAIDPAMLYTTPAPDTNAIAVLVHHTLGSERQVLRLLADLPAPRDRSAEFLITGQEFDRNRLMAELDAADQLLTEVGPRITAERLQVEITRPGQPPTPGLTLLVTNYGHAREHLAHLQLTRQVLEQGAGAAR